MRGAAPSIGGRARFSKLPPAIELVLFVFFSSVARTDEMSLKDYPQPLVSTRLNYGHNGRFWAWNSHYWNRDWRRQHALTVSLVATPILNR